MFVYITIYFLIGVVFVGSVHLRRWWLTRKHKYRDSVLSDFMLIPLTAWFWPLLMYMSWRDGLPQYQDHSNAPNVLAAERRQEDRKQFMQQLPYCSAVVRLDVSAFPDNLDSCGILYLESEALWQEISLRVAQNPHLAQDDEGYLMAWLATRQTHDQTPCDAPIAFPRLSVSADVLVRKFHGHAECKKCGRTYAMQSLTFCDDVGRPTSNYNQVQCPQGHLLLKRLRIRFIRSTPR
jgi:hypothetical protein